MVEVEFEVKGTILTIVFKGYDSSGKPSVKRIDEDDLLLMRYRDGKPFGFFFHSFIACMAITGECEYELSPEYEEQVRALEPFVHNGAEYAFEELLEQHYRENKDYYDQYRSPSQRERIAKLAGKLT